MRVVKGTPKYFSKTGSLDSFTYLMLLFEWSCNYKCLKCFKRGKKPPRDGLLGLDQRIDLIEQAKQMNGKVVVFAGEGEPTTHPQFKDLILKTHSYEMTPIVYTNASRLNPHLIEFCKSNGAVFVVALDSLMSDKYNFLTGGENLDTTLKNIDMLRTAYHSTMQTNGNLTTLNLALNMTLFTLNIGELPTIKRFAGTDMYFICNPLHKSGAALENWDKLMLGIQDPNAFADLIKDYSEAGGPLTLGSDGLCGYSEWGIAVSPEGKYKSCAYTDETDGFLSDVSKAALKEAFEYKQCMEAAHYKKQGVSKCLVRATSFKDYLAVLSAEQAFCCCYGQKVGMASRKKD
jgi:MoaA/NifB/PqqE/SkfB family radical SAM enzyme